MVTIPQIIQIFLLQHVARRCGFLPKNNPQQDLSGTAEMGANRSSSSLPTIDRRASLSNGENSRSLEYESVRDMLLL